MEMTDNKVTVENQVNFINTLKVDIQKLILSLGAGALVFSISFLQAIPKPQNRITSIFLIWFWILLTVSIVSGVLTLVFGAWWYGNKLIMDRSKEEKYKTKLFQFLTTFCKISADIFEHINIWSFIVAMILASIFVITVFSAQNAPI